MIIQHIHLQHQKREHIFFIVLFLQTEIKITILIFY
jgi:hypothetical protein